MITPYPDYVSSGLTHATPFDHTQEVPLLLYGPGIVRAGVYEPATLTDVSQTAASMLEFDGFTAPDGRALDEALLPIDERTPPKLLVTMVWDSAGVDLLERWPRSWPYLRQLARRCVVHGRAAELGTREHPEPRHDRHRRLPPSPWLRRRVHLDQRVAAEAERRRPDLHEAADLGRRLRPRDGQRADRWRGGEPLGAPDDDGPRARVAGRDDDIAVAREVQGAATGGDDTANEWGLTDGMRPYYRMPIG